MIRLTLRYFSLIYVPAALLLLSAFAVWQSISTKQERMRIETEETARVHVAADLIFHSLDDITADLLLLASSSCLHRFVTDGRSADLACTEALFAGLVREKRLYDQARFLDENGMEILRVNLAGGQAILVPKSQLQAKGDRYYFQDAIALDGGEVFISPLDLNIEHGQIELPHKPMLRLATPVKNSNGEKKGVVVLNLLGNILLDRFREAMGTSPQPMLLNRDGYWLSHPRAEKTWGFMFGRPDTLATEYPQDWRQLNATDDGRFRGTAGLYSFATVHPLRAGQRSSFRSGRSVRSNAQERADKNYFWKVVSLVPAEALPTAGLFDTPQRVAGLLAGGLLLAMLVVPIAATSANRKRLQQELDEEQQQLREVTIAMGEGLLMLNEAGRIVFANPAAEDLLGRTKVELLNQHAHLLLHHRQRDGTPLAAEECPILRLLSSGGCYRSDRQVFWRPDETPLPVEVNACALMRDNRPTGIVVAFQDISARLSAQEKIHQLAFHDPVTGLPNRRLLFDRLKQALAQNARHKRTLALLFIDLDGFKQINDTFGHAGGDELLDTIARRINSAVRSGDTVARQGGDEFIVLLAELATADEAGEVTKKILSICREPVIIDGQPAFVGASIGIAIASGADDDADNLMQKADKAMYVAKAAGRNTFRYFTSA